MRSISHSYENARGRWIRAALVPAVGVMVAAAMYLGGGMSAVAGETNAAAGSVSAGENGLVIRGGTCSADAFKNGSGVTVIPPGSNNIFDLSVNCTTATSKKANYAQYTGGIPNPTFCVATIQDLERLGAKVARDPIKGNALHCLVSGDAKRIAGKLTRYP